MLTCAFAVAFTTGLAGGCGSTRDPLAGAVGQNDPDALRVQVLEELPHDPSSFTQGLELADGMLYESTGRIGESRVLAIDPDTGAVRQQVQLPPPLFGEGITVLDGRIWQLTWTSGVAIERDQATLAELRRVRYQGEGWGLCSDGDLLVMSDGTDRLTFRDPETFTVTGQVRVRQAGRPVDRLNELECVDGAVWANVWQTDRIVRIDPSDGAVTAAVDAAGLLSPAQRARADVLNGIAAVPGTDQFLITGKHWPMIFRVRFVPS